MNQYTTDKLEDIMFWARVEARKNKISYSRLDGPEVFDGYEFLKDYDRNCGS